MRIPPVSFLESGSHYINSGRGQNVSERIFKSHFRLDPESCSVLWGRLTTYILDDYVENSVMLSTCEPTVHLLWVLHFMYVYSSEEVCASFFGVTAKTYRKYVQAMIRFLHTLSTDLVSIFTGFLYFKIYFVPYSLTFIPRLISQKGSTKTTDPNVV